MNLLHKINKLHNIKIPSIHITINQKVITNLYNDNNNNFILLLRDPVKRFISAYYHRYFEYKLYKNTGKVFKKKTQHYYIAYDNDKKKYFEYFDSVNKLAEALNSDDETIKHLANKFCRKEKLLSYDFNYFLINKKMIDKIGPRIKYVIRNKYYNDDFKLFYKKYCEENNLEEKELNLEEKINNSNKYNKNKYLSEKAIKNIKNFYKKDYKILKYLVEKDIITQEYFNLFI